MTKSALDLIGNTPLVEFKNLKNNYTLTANLFAKIESFNLTGSVKDRPVKEMIENAEKTGVLKENSVIIEPTSGNTGIAIAAIAKAKGYKVILTMPETMSIERRNILKSYGAELVLTEGSKGMKGAIEKAKELSETIENGLVLGQFTNIDNVKSHEKTTGPEIWADTDGKVDIFVAGVGTGGTITGVSNFLKSKNPNIQIVAVEPIDSPVLSGGNPGPHPIQGIGAGFIPSILDVKAIDKIIKVSGDDAVAIAKEIPLSEGFAVGISSGAAMKAALELAFDPANSGKNIVVLLPDSSDRYFSTKLFE